MACIDLRSLNIGSYAQQHNPLILFEYRTQQHITLTPVDSKSSCYLLRVVHLHKASSLLNLSCTFKPIDPWSKGIFNEPSIRPLTNIYSIFSSEFPGKRTTLVSLFIDLWSTLIKQRTSER